MVCNLPLASKTLSRQVAGIGILSLVLACAAVPGGAQAVPPARSAERGTVGNHIYKGQPGKFKIKRQKGSEEVAQAAPAPPPPPPTPEQMPAVAPEVIYSGGLLTINAQNSTMNDVLAAVRRVTGASIEKPPMGGSDRVVVHLGPGQPKDVLEALFHGSRYDYIILGSMDRPGGVERIILTARTAATPGSPVVTSTAPPRPAVQPPVAGQEEPDTTDTEDMTVPEREQEEPEQPQPEQQQPQNPQPPQGQYPQPVTPQQAPQTQNPPGQGEQGQQPRVKSPEELLRELQQMQKQPPDQNEQQAPQ